LGNTITREKLLEILSGLSYNLDGSVNKDSEVVRNYTINVIDGKVHIDLFTLPVEINVDGEWKNIDEVVAEEDKSFLYEAFMERHLMGKIILDTDDPTGISVRSRDRVRHLPNKIQEAGIELPREFSWVDGAKDISGVIILPQDDYDKVFIATDPDDDGYPQIIFIKDKETTGGVRPYYEKKDGQTYIYVEHFSGGGGTQADPYLVENEDDLNNVRNNLGAYYVQTADILMTKFQTGAGFQPIGTSGAVFSGYYDGRGYEIKDLYINRPTEDCVGLFGYQNAGIIKRVKLVNVNITGKSYVGALAGRSNGHIYDCAALSGTVVGSSAVGGLVGYKSGGNQYRCYSHVEVRADTNNVGGHIGSITGGIVDKCFSTGKVVDLTVAQTIANKGGFFGYVGGGSASGCFWDIETSGMSTSPGSPVGKMTADMKNQATFSSAGWDFEQDFKMGGSKVNRGYPENQRFIRFAKGKGTAADPYLIYTEEDLKLVRHYLYAHFRLMDDITLTYPTTGKGFTGIGRGASAGSVVDESAEAFTGVFDGNGKTIGNLYMNSPTEDYVALFRYLRGVVKNLNVVDANLTGRNHTAGLVGWSNTKLDGSRAEIKNCRVAGFNGANLVGNQYTSGLIGYAQFINITDCLVENVDVSGNSYSSGFVGYAYDMATISKSASKNSRVMSSGSYAGGFLGNHDYYNLTISDCYARNEITAAGGLGGFSARHYYYSGTRNIRYERCVSESYASDGSPCPFHGDWASPYASGIYITDCFYDRNVANSSSTAGGAQPKYTAEMKHPSTFSTFDLVNTWVLDSQYNDGYLELRKFIPVNTPILGFRNQFGDYYTDAQGNILRYLEYGTIVAGDTSDIKPVWLQNNANFAVKDMKVWVDPATVADGITVELSLSDHPFTPVNEILFPGTVPIGESRKFYVRFVADVTVNSGGTFDLKAKASPV
jgi:hypothetical protein